MVIENNVQDEAEYNEDNELLFLENDSEGNVTILSEYKPETGLDPAWMEKIQNEILSADKAENMGAGSCGTAGGVDGSMYNKGILLSVSHTYENKVGIGIDFGSGSGTTALTFAAISKWHMFGVEVKYY